MTTYESIFNSNGEIKISHDELVNKCIDALWDGGAGATLLEEWEQAEEVAFQIEKCGLYEVDKDNEDVKAWLDLEDCIVRDLYRIPTEPNDYNCQQCYICFSGDWE